METPKLVQNIGIGSVASTKPRGVKSRGPERWPSWKTKTIAPKLAVRLRILTTTAFNGMKTEPKVMSRIRYVTPITKAAAKGALPYRLEIKSFWPADNPPTRKLV